MLVEVIAVLSKAASGGLAIWSMVHRSNNSKEDLDHEEGVK
jgi:hypothetical protein